MRVWDQAGIELATPGSAVRQVSAVRHVTNCATRPGVTVMRYHALTTVNIEDLSSMVFLILIICIMLLMFFFKINFVDIFI